MILNDPTLKLRGLASSSFRACPTGVGENRRNRATQADGLPLQGRMHATDKVGDLVRNPALGEAASVHDPRRYRNRFIECVHGALLSPSVTVIALSDFLTSPASYRTTLVSFRLSNSSGLISTAAAGSFFVMTISCVGIDHDPATSPLNSSWLPRGTAFSNMTSFWLTRIKVIMPFEVVNPGHSGRREDADRHPGPNLRAAGEAIRFAKVIRLSTAVSQQSSHLAPTCRFPLFLGRLRQYTLSSSRPLCEHRLPTRNHS